MKSFKWPTGKMFHPSLPWEKQETGRGTCLQKINSFCLSLVQQKPCQKRGNEDSFFPPSMWRNKNSIFTSKQNFLTTKTLSVTLWKVHLQFLPPANLMSICRDRSQTWQVTMSLNLRRIPLQGTGGKSLQGWVSLRCLYKVDTGPWSSRCHFLYEKSSILYFSTYS